MISMQCQSQDQLGPEWNSIGPNTIVCDAMYVAAVYNTCALLLRSNNNLLWLHNLGCSEQSGAFRRTGQVMPADRHPLAENLWRQGGAEPRLLLPSYSSVFYSWLSALANGAITDSTSLLQAGAYLAGAAERTWQAETVAWRVRAAKRRPYRDQVSFSSVHCTAICREVPSIEAWRQWRVLEQMSDVFEWAS